MIRPVWLGLLLCACTGPPAPAKVYKRAHGASVGVVWQTHDGSYKLVSGALVGDPPTVLVDGVAGRQTRVVFGYREDDDALGPEQAFATGLPATIVASDPTWSLTALRVSDGPSEHEGLPSASEPAMVADAVYLLDQHKPWTAPTGSVELVSDAEIVVRLTGDSAAYGAVLDVRGRLVGWSPSHIGSLDHGRRAVIPFAGLEPLLKGRATSLATVDLRTPSMAAMTCAAAQLRADALVTNCYDWQHKWQRHQADVREAGALGVFEPGSIEEGDRQAWITHARRQALFMVQPLTPPPAVPLTPQNLRASLGELGVSVDRYDQVMDALLGESEADGQRWVNTLTQRTGLSEAPVDALIAHRLLKRGLRVSRVVYVADDLAWVELGATNANGTSAGWSELYRSTEAQWRQLDPITPELAQSLPEGWRPPLHPPRARNPDALWTVLHTEAVRRVGK